ncbi:hypothetical protein FDG2_0399 [Candidatus Protofrankia californiensis]|uniref:Uncharacterized protein n=1 Tax=Candidatus Protofrankia californiensis TaxID=1839754 RepID=A0A1C3NTG5_9ACTN|nr:hypothetical protein FDG2_0399 [Candidatus Protofrankia californiensis]
MLADSRVRVAGKIEELLATHRRLSGLLRDPPRLPAHQHVISSSHVERHNTFIIRTDAPIHDPVWDVSQLSLEDLVLTYMSPPVANRNHRPVLKVQR